MNRPNQRVPRGVRRRSPRSLDFGPVHFREWSQLQFADDKWVRDTIQSLGPDATEEQIFQALRRVGHSQDRGTRINLAREHIFYHLAQTFDRLVAITIGVAALNHNIV